MSIDDLPPLGPAPEDFQTRELRWQMAQKLFGEFAPNLMKIGRFTLEGELGTGGQGTVYEAVDAELDRRVAIKRIVATDPQHRQRMRQEGRALARVTHPNVVQIYEVGEDETERPYLVMELVRGEPLHQWLRNGPHHWTEVVALMAAVGDGLAAIHAAKVMHRDVKPHNIIIQEDGKAKLIDLGIAVLDATEEESATPDGAGTVGYMAPEGYDGRFDARSDQFGFCVTLYEALCGVRPSRSMTRSSTTASKSSDAFELGTPLGSATDETDTHGRAPVVAEGLGDAPQQLRAVLIRGMQEDPAQRYEDMASLVAALRDALPRPRQWPIVTIAGTLMALTLAGAGAAMALAAPPSACDVDSPAAALWDDTAKANVRAAFEQAERAVAAPSFDAVDSMLTDTISTLDERWGSVCDLPTNASTRPIAQADLRARHETLDAIVSSLAEVNAPDVANVAVRLDPALAVLRSDEPRDACEQTQTMSELPPHLQGVQLARNRAVALGVAGRYDEALDSASRALEQLGGSDLEGVRASLMLERGRLALDAVRLDDAEKDLEDARSQAERLGCDALAAHAMALFAKAEALEPHGNLDRAEVASKQALDKLDRLGTQGPRRAEALKNRGLVLRKQRDLQAAADHFQQALEIWGPSAPLDRTDAMLDLAIVWAQQGEPARSIELLREAVAIRERVLGPNHPSLYKFYATLSYRHLQQGEFEASHADLSRAIELANRGLGPDHPRLGTLHIAMVRLLDYQQKFAEALRHAELADRILAEAHGERDIRRIDSLEAIGQVHMDADDPMLAIPSLRESLEIQSASPDADPWSLAIGRAKLAWAHTRSGNPEAALPLYERAHRVLEADPARRDDPFVPDMLMGWGEALVASGQLTEAVTPLTEAETLWARAGTNPERLARTRWWLAQALCPTEPEQARERAREAQKWFEANDTEGARVMQSEISGWFERDCSEGQ